MSVLDEELKKSEVRASALQGAKFLHAYLECSDEIQAGIRSMLKILVDSDADPDDVEMTLHTLADTLFPNPHNGQLGMDLAESEQMGAVYSPEMKEAIDNMDREEAMFADRLEAIMKERKLSQEGLAKLVGVGQPAISNMLNRQCRPQRATIKRFADALGVAPDALWPQQLKDSNA
jgi:lambda repressor-like predicted transcriptional regulator